MKPQKHHLFTAILLVACFQLKAEINTPFVTDTTITTSETTTSKHSFKQNENEEHENKSLLKLNPPGLIVKNYSLQYERRLNKKLSAAITVRVMPYSSLPFKKAFTNSTSLSAETKKNIENFQLSDIAFTPELRIYLGKKGYGRGFYIAPFYRYSSFKTNSFIIDYINDAGDASSLSLSGKLTSNTGGFLLGAQWLLGKHFCLDWSILGPHFGKENGTFDGVSNTPLSKNEQTQIRSQLNNLDLPFTNKTIIVNSDGVSMNINGPWGGIRTGLALGVIF